MSLTVILCKIFERILKKALRNFLSETRSISLLPTPSVLSLQFAGLQGSGDAHDERGPHTIYLGFAKAFDSVNHRFLLMQMNSLSLGDVDGRWFKAELSKRVSRVENMVVENLGGEGWPVQCTVVFRRAP